MLLAILDRRNQPSSFSVG